MKQRLFRVMSSPAWMRLFPRRGADPEWADLAGAADVVIKGHAGDWSIIPPGQGRRPRDLPPPWQSTMARGIGRRPAVAAGSPRAIAWDDGRGGVDLPAAGGGRCESTGASVGRRAVGAWGGVCAGRDDSGARRGAGGGGDPGAVAGAGAGLPLPFGRTPVAAAEEPAFAGGGEVVSRLRA